MIDKQKWMQDSSIETRQKIRSYDFPMRWKLNRSFKQGSFINVNIGPRKTPNSDRIATNNLIIKTVIEGF